MFKSYKQPPEITQTKKRNSDKIRERKEEQEEKQCEGGKKTSSSLDREAYCISESG